MKIITVSNLLFGLSLFLSLAAEAKITDRLALYGESKYTSDFKAFDYVNSEAPQGGQIVCRTVDDVAAEGNLSALDRFKRVDTAQQRTLATAGGSDDNHHFLLRNRQIYAV